MSLIAHYKLDGNANDAFGKYNGTASGALVFEDGKLGKCINLKTSGSVTFPTSIKYTYSVSFWYKRLSPPSGSYQKIFTKGSDRSPGFWTGSTDFLHLRQSLVNGGNSGADIYGIGTGVWRHIVFTCEQTAAGVRINSYMDGVKSTSSSFYAGDTVNITGDPNSFVLNSNSVVGHSLDDVRIYDHALSEREVRDLSQGLVLHYTFDQFQEPTENLLRKSGATPLVSVGDFLGRSTKTINADGSVRFVNNGTGESVLRLYCNLADLSSGETYSIQVKFRENTGTVSLDWCDTPIVNGLASSTASSGLLYGIGTRATYNGGYRFLDINISSGGSITLYEDQIEKKKYVTPFVNGTRTGIVRDQSTQGNDAPLALANTPKWVEGGMVGKGCYEFDGVDDEILSSHSSANISSDKASFCAWVYHNQRASSYSTIIHKSAQYSISVCSSTGGLTYSDSTALDYSSFGCHGVVPLNAWTHISAVRNGTSVILYINGVQVVAKTTGTVINTTTNSLYIGAYKDTNYLPHYWKGQIDDVRIYTTALSAEEIKELYEQRASLDAQGNFYSNLISSNIGYQKVWGDGTGVGFTTYGINESSVSTNGVLRFTTTNTDPMINMYNIGSFDPKVYKFIQVKYRVVSGNAGRVEIVFTNTQYTSANAAQVRHAPLNSDGNWNVVTAVMHTHANWTNSNITGWRFDMGTASGVTIEVEWIRLVSDTGALSVKSNKVVGNFSEVGITNGLVAYYPLNKDAKDYSGNGNHGTVTGAVLTGGGFDGKGAYRFNGYPHSITGLGQHTSLTKFTYSAWINRSVNQDNFLILGARQGDNTYISMAVIGNRVCLHKYGFNSNLDINVATGNTLVNTGVWRHIVITYDDGVTKTFVDGVLDGSGFHINTSYSAVGMQINYEGGVSDTDKNFKGDISNVKIFNRALTPEEIAVEYKQRTGVSKMTQHNGTTYIQGQVKETI